MVTLHDAERIRRTLGLSVYAFSVRLGYSPTAYHYAQKRGRLSRWMGREIATRFGRILARR